MVKLQVLLLGLCVLAVAGPKCCTPLPGKDETVGSVLSYISSHHAPTAAVVLASDVFGFEAPLLREFADNIAAAGYFVVVPDFFNKDFYVATEDFNEWIKNHQPLDSVGPAKQVVESLRHKGFASIGAVGFCWGAKVVVELAKGKTLKAVVIAHPSFVTVRDIRDVKTPIAILLGELDTTTPPALAQKFIDILKSKPELESFARIYPGVAHGWTIRYDPANPKAVADAEEAHRKMLEWLGKFLP